MRAVRIFRSLSRIFPCLTWIFLSLGLAGGMLPPPPLGADAAGFEASSDQIYSLEERSHWSFRPIERAVPPEFDDLPARSWIRTPIDAFVLQQLRSVGLQPSPPAPPETLVRRLHFDLAGLPPLPEDVDAFCYRPDDEAW